MQFVMGRLLGGQPQVQISKGAVAAAVPNTWL
jgi:hypothetical protein